MEDVAHWMSVLADTLNSLTRLGPAGRRIEAARSAGTGRARIRSRCLLAEREEPENEGTPRQNTQSVGELLASLPAFEESDSMKRFEMAAHRPLIESHGLSELAHIGFPGLGDRAGETQDHRIGENGAPVGRQDLAVLLAHGSGPLVPVATNAGCVVREFLNVGPDHEVHRDGVHHCRALPSDSAVAQLGHLGPEAVQSAHQPGSLVERSVVRAQRLVAGAGGGDLVEQLTERQVSVAEIPHVRPSNG